MSDFVLQPEEEFLAAHPGPAKIMVQVRELHHLLLHNFLLFLAVHTGCLMHIVAHPLAPPRSWCRCAKRLALYLCTQRDRIRREYPPGLAKIMVHGDTGPIQTAKHSTAKPEPACCTLQLLVKVPVLAASSAAGAPASPVQYAVLVRMWAGSGYIIYGKGHAT